jgi:hypothetical protein
VYVWAVDNAGNAGLSANDSIIVDSVAPYISDVENRQVNHTSSGDMGVNATISDYTSGFNMIPVIEYRYGRGYIIWYQELFPRLDVYGDGDDIWKYHCLQ